MEPLIIIAEGETRCGGEVVWLSGVGGVIEQGLRCCLHRSILSIHGIAIYGTLFLDGLRKGTFILGA